MIVPDQYVHVLNLNKKIEVSKHIGSVDSISFSGKFIYSLNNNYFVGGMPGNYISSCKYDLQTSFNIPDTNIFIIYPNPTSNIVNIPIPCSNTEINYQIFDIVGALLLNSTIQISNNNSFTIDFSKYKNGTYILKLNCGKNITTYKINKQG